VLRSLQHYAQSTNWMRNGAFSQRKHILCNKSGNIDFTCIFLHYDCIAVNKPLLMMGGEKRRFAQDQNNKMA